MWCRVRAKPWHKREDVLAWKSQARQVVPVSCFRVDASNASALMLMLMRNTHQLWCESSCLCQGFALTWHHIKNFHNFQNKNAIFIIFKNGTLHARKSDIFTFSSCFVRYFGQVYFKFISFFGCFWLFLALFWWKLMIFMNNSWFFMKIWWKIAVFHDFSWFHDRSSFRAYALFEERSWVVTHDY